MDTELFSGEEQESQTEAPMIHGHLGPFTEYGKLRSKTLITGFLDTRGVEGKNYYDVIEVEHTLSYLLLNEDGETFDSYIEEQNTYWFANGIGLIETTDKGYKLQPS